MAKIPNKMPKQASKCDDPEQSKRFIETAREIGADESGEEFRKALKKIAPPKKRKFA
jgi:hypothetical protein